jgi:hypothetical protein
VVEDRQALDERVLAGEDISGEELMAALTGESPPQDALLQLYAVRVLQYALNQRDTEAASILAHLMDTYPELDEALNQRLDKALETQPDAVYAFIRTRMNEGADVRWLPRLRQAAEHSLQVANQDGDIETILNWLTLIAREPATYGLGDVLHEAILEARERAHQDSELARQLILFAAKRDPAALDVLLADENLVAILPDNSGRLLREYEGDPLALLQKRGIEIFLVAMARAARVASGTLFTSLTIAQVWAIYRDGMTAGLPLVWQPYTILSDLIARSADLTDDALETLLTLIAGEKRDDWFHEVVQQMGERTLLVAMIATSLHRSQRTPDDILTLIGKAVSDGDLTQQQALDIYIALANLWEWPKSALPAIEQIGRMLKQQASLTIPTDALWRLLDIAADGKIEQAARAATRRLTSEFELIEDETQLTDDLLRLWSQAQWSASTRQLVIDWWRDFIRSRHLTQLQRLDKALEGKRVLEELRAIIQTALAFRRMLGHRSLKEFSEAINTAFGVLDDLAESFEATAKRPVNLDQSTLRAELDARDGELPPHERQVLANNLKELAQLIAAMGDSRSKANLIRRGDDLDRDLMSGEQTPHSAVDAMKWLAGYWAGAQEKEESDE